MFGRKNKLKTDSSSDDDFGSFDDDDFGGFDESPSPGNDRKSSLVSQSIRAATDAISFKFNDPAERRRLIKKSLPDTYTQPIDFGNELGSDMMDLYREQEKEWEANKPRLKKGLKPYSGILRSLRLKKLADWIEVDDSRSSSDFAQENMEEASVQSMLAEFSQGAGRSAPRQSETELEEEEARDENDVEERAQDLQFQETSTRNQLKGIASSSATNEQLGKMVAYQDQVTFKYQLKNLEIGMRSLIENKKQSELLRLFKEEAVPELKEIHKNTGLPDAIKINQSEMASRILKEKMINRAAGWMDGKTGVLRKRIINKTKQSMKEFWATFGGGVSQLEDMAQEGDEEARSQGGNLIKGIIADSIVGKPYEYVTGKISEKLKEFTEKNDTIRSMGSSMSAILGNGQAMVNSGLKDGFGNKLIDGVVDKLGLAQAAIGSDNRVRNSYDGNLDTAQYMDVRFKKSIETVIPGWLAKIHKETYLMRVGSKDDKDYTEESWSWENETFVTNKSLGEKALSEIVDIDKVTKFNDSVERFLNHLDPDAIFTPKTRAEIRKWFIEKIKKSDHVSVIRLLKDEGKFTELAREELREKLPFLTGIKIQDVDDMTVGNINEERKFLMSKASEGYKSFTSKSGSRVNEARNQSIIDLNRLAKLVEKYDPKILEQIGVLVRDADGGLSLNEKFQDGLTDNVGRKVYTQLNELVKGADGNDDLMSRNAKPEDFSNEDVEHSAHKLRGFKTLEELARAAQAKKDGAKIDLFGSQFPHGGFAAGGKISLARGGSTGDLQPDQVADVEVHGQEFVVNSDATKNNEKILAWINKLNAPLIGEDGTPNRAYHKLFGFSSAEDMDIVGKGKKVGRDLLDSGKQLTAEVSNEMISKIEDIVDFSVFSAAELKQVTSEKMPNAAKLKLLVKGAMLTQKAEFHADKTGYVKKAGRNFLDGTKNALKNAINRDGTTTNSDIVKGLGEMAGRGAKNVKGKATAAVNKLGDKFNSKLGVDWERTSSQFMAMGDRFDAGTETKKDLKLKKVLQASSGALDLYLPGSEEPILTARGFRSGEYKVMDPVSNIWQTIQVPFMIAGDVYGTKTEELIVSAEDLVTHGVFTRRGTKVTLPLLDNEFLFFKKKRDKLKELWGDVKSNDKVQARVNQAKEISSKFLFDKPTDIYIHSDPINPVLTAAGFKRGEYINTSNGKTLVSHHDIDSVVKDLQGNVLISEDDLTWGLFDKEANPIKLSQIKRMRNIGMAKGVEAYKKYAKKHVDKYAKNFATSLMNFQEDWSANKKAEQINLYLASDPTKVVLSAEGFKNGSYISAKTKKVISRFGQIDGPVILVASGEVILDEQQLTMLVDVKGDPITLTRMMSLKDRVVKVGKDALRLPGFAQKKLDKMLQFGKGAIKKDEEETTDKEELAFGKTDVYIKSNQATPLKILSVNDLINQYAFIVDSKGKKAVLKSYADFKNMGELWLFNEGKSTSSKVNMTVEDLADGLYDSTGTLLYKFKANAEREQAKGAIGKSIDKIKGFFADKLKVGEANADEAKVESNFGQIDLYLKFQNEPTFRAAKLFTKSYTNITTKKAVTSYEDLDGTIMDVVSGQVIATKKDMAKGLFDIEGNLIFKPEVEKKESSGFMAGLKKFFSAKEKEAKVSPDGYKQGEDSPIIIGADLDAGKYTNAITGATITKYEEMFDGVIDSKGNKILYPADVEAGLFSDKGKLLTKRKKMSLKNKLKNKLGGMVSSVKGAIGKGLGKVGSAVKKAASVAGTAALAVPGLGKAFSKLDTLKEGSWQWLREKKNQAAKAVGLGGGVDAEGKKKSPWWMKLLTPLLAGFGLITKGLSGLGSMLMKGIWGVAKFAGKGAWKVAKGLGKLVGKNLWPMLSWGFKGVMAAVAMSGSIMGKAGKFLGKGGRLLGKGAGMLLGGRGRLLKGAALAGAGYLGYKAMSGDSAAAPAAAGAAAGGEAGPDNVDGGPQFDESGQPIETPASAAEAPPGEAAPKTGLGKAWDITKTVAAFAAPSLLLSAGGRAALGIGARIALGALTGPVGLAVLAGTVAYYGGKFLYGKWKKGKLLEKSPLLAFRMSQYGFAFTDEASCSKILELEDYLSKFVSVSSSGPTISDKADPNKVFGIFGVSPEDMNQKERFSKALAWFSNRFKPVYLSHVMQANKAVKQINLNEIDEKLDKPQKLVYLEGVHFKDDSNISPYASMVSPFEKPKECDTDQGDVDKLYGKVKDIITEMVEPVKGATKDGEKETDPTKVDASGAPLGKDEKAVKKDEGDSWIKRQLSGLTTLKVASKLAMGSIFGMAGLATKKMLGMFGIDVDKYIGMIGDKLKAAKDKVVGYFTEGDDGAPAPVVQDLNNAAESVVDGVGNFFGGIGKSVTGMVSSVGEKMTGKAKWSGRTTDTLFANLQQASQKYGIPEEYMRTMAYIESKGDNSATSQTGAKGIFQFTKGTGKAYGLLGGPNGDIRTNEQANVDAGARLALDNAKFFKKRFGVAPEPWQLYMMHQQGAGGFCAVWEQARTNAAPTPAVRKSMDLNGGQGKSPAQFMAMWKDKWATSQSLVMGTPAPAGTPATGGGGGQGAPGNTQSDLPVATNTGGQLTATQAAQPATPAKGATYNGPMRLTDEQAAKAGVKQGAVPAGQKVKDGVAKGTVATPNAKVPITKVEKSENNVMPAGKTIASIVQALDPALIERGKKSYRLNKKSITLSGMKSEFMAMFYAMIGEYNIKTGKTILITDGFRSSAQQKAMYDAWVAGGKRGSAVAKPGSSNHERGIALDCDTPDVERLISSGVFDKYHFHRPYLHFKKSETWHIECKLITKNNFNNANAMIKDQQTPVTPQQQSVAAKTSASQNGNAGQAAPEQSYGSQAMQQASGSSAGTSAMVAQTQSNMSTNTDVTNNILANQLTVQSEIRDMVKEMRDKVMGTVSVAKVTDDKRSLDNLKEPVPATDSKGVLENALNSVVEGLLSKLGGNQPTKNIPSPPVAASK